MDINTDALTSASASATATADNAIVKLQAFLRGCMTRQKVSNMIAEVIDELERVLQNQTEESAPLTGDDHDERDGTATPNTHQKALALDMLERSHSNVSVSSSVSAFDEQELDDYLQHLVRDGDDNDQYKDMDLESSMESALDNDQDNAHQPGQLPGPADYDYTDANAGTIDTKIERYLESPKNSIKPSVNRDIVVKRGSVQAATSMFSAPLHDTPFTITPKKPKKQWKPNDSKPSPRLSSPSIMDKVHVFSQSLPIINMDDDDPFTPVPATSPRRKRGNQDKAQTVRKALAGRHRLMGLAATTIQARARGYLVRKFDIKAMNKVLQYVREFQSLGLGWNQHDNDEIPVGPESEPCDDTPDPMDTAEDPLPEPEVEELEKAWSVLQHNRAYQTHHQDPTAPADDEHPEPIKVKELLSTWEWLKANQQATSYHQPKPRILPQTPPSSPPSSQVQQQQQQLPFDEPPPSPTPSLDGPSDVEKSANSSLPMASTDNALSSLPDKGQGQSLPNHAAEQLFSLRISDSAPPRTGDLVAFYSWLEQNKLYHASATLTRRDAAAEIEQAKQKAITTKDPAQPINDELTVNLPTQSTSTEPPLSSTKYDDELESSESTSQVVTTAGDTNTGDPPNALALESTASVQEQKPDIPGEKQQEIDQYLTTEQSLSRSTSTPQSLLSSPSTSQSIKQQEDTTTEVILNPKANQYPHASPSSAVDGEQHQMEATLVAISHHLDSLASSTGPTMDCQWNSSEQMLLRKIKDNIRTGKVNFDEVFELWTWLEMNDFDMTKFKRRAIELGIVEAFNTDVNGPVPTTKKLLPEMFTTTTKSSKLDRSSPSQVGSVQSRIQANSQNLDHKVHQHGFVRPKSNFPWPVPTRKDSTESRPTDRENTETRPCTIEYVNDDLSAVYRPQTSTVKKRAQNWYSNVYVQADQAKHASSDDGRANPGDNNYRGIRGNESRSSPITYLDEDLSTVDRGHNGETDRSRNSDSMDIVAGVQRGGEISTIINQGILSDQSLQKIEEKQTSGSPIEYLDEDLSDVYRRGLTEKSRANKNSEDTTTQHGSESPNSDQIIYLDEDLSNVYRQGQTELSRTSKKIEDTPALHAPELQRSDASHTNIEYIDEDLSRYYTSKTNQGEGIARPSLQAMVSYWEFSKLNNSGNKEIAHESEEAESESLADHDTQGKQNDPSWLTNPSNNKMMNTLKWLEKQGVDLDAVEVTDESSDSLADSTEDLDLSAAQLESNAAKAATLKEQDLTKTMDWLMTHGHMTSNSTKRGSRSGMQELSSKTDISATPAEGKVDIVDNSPPVGETTRRQTKTDLTDALRWLQGQCYQASGRRSSVTDISECAPTETQFPHEDRLSGNKTPEPKRAGTHEKATKRRDELYDKNVLYSLSWLQKHGFDLDKSIHAERKHVSLPSEKQKVATSQASESEPAPTIESLMDALSTINDAEDTKGNHSTGRSKTPSETSQQDVGNSLKWLAVRGIGKPKKKGSKKRSGASSLEVKPTRKNPSRELVSAPTEKSPRTEDKDNLSSHEMSDALKWLNRKGISAKTTNPAKSAIVKSQKAKRSPKALTNMDTKKILDMMKNQGTLSQNQRLSEEDIEQTLRFLKLQDSKEAALSRKIEDPANKVPIESKAKHSELMKTKQMEKDSVLGSKRESRVNEAATQEPSSALLKDKKNSMKKVSRPGASRPENSTLLDDSDPSSSQSKHKSSSKTKSKSIDRAKEKPTTEKKSNSRSSKTRSESPGPRKNRPKAKNINAMRSKSGDFLGDMISDPKKASPSTSSTADMQKTLKWLQTKASMASPLKTPQSPVPSKLSSKDWKSKVPSLAPLGGDDRPSSRAQLPPLPGKKKGEKPQMETKSVQDYHNALTYLNSKDSAGLEDALYFKKLDKTLPKRPGESKEARAKEMARALAWVKKQGLFDATSKSSRKSEALEKTPPGPASSIKDTISSLDKEPLPNTPEKAPTNQHESKVQTERKKLTSIKDMTKQALQRQKELNERLKATSSPSIKRSNSSEQSDPQDFANALTFVLTRQAGGDVTGITDAVNFKKLDNMLPHKSDQSSEDRASEMVKMLEWLRKKGRA